MDYCHYYENTFLYRELIKKDRDHMVGMFGFVGLAECVNGILGLTDEKERFGHGEKADALGEAIMDDPSGDRQEACKVWKVRSSRPGGSDGGYGFNARRKDSH